MKPKLSEYINDMSIYTMFGYIALLDYLRETVRLCDIAVQQKLYGTKEELSEIKKVRTRIKKYLQDLDILVSKYQTEMNIPPSVSQPLSGALRQI